MATDAYVFLSKQLVIFWSRKAGTTSLSEWVYDAAVRLPKRFEQTVAPRRFLNAGQFAIDDRLALDLIQNLGFEDFILARNPYRRAVSVYVEKFVRYGKNRLDAFDKLKPFSQRAAEDMLAMKSGRADSVAGGDYPGVSFVDFLDYVAERIRTRRKGKGTRLNGHFAPQASFHCDEQGFAYSNIIRLERVAEEIGPLAARLGTAAPFPANRVSPVRPNWDGETDLSQMSSVEMISKGIVPTSESLLSARARELIREAYEIDFRMLGYDPDAV